MIIKENESLAKYTTFKMGGVAGKMYEPETVEELTALVREKPQLLDYVIGGGSNLLINDGRRFDEVLCLRSFNTRLEHLGDGRYYVGASVRLQKLIKAINADGYGGIEYLYSVPGLLGGAVYMNAGRGRQHHKCISDYMISADVSVNAQTLVYEKKDCGFDYRRSVFQEMKGCVILGAVFQFPPMSAEESAGLVKERLELCRRVQDMSAPNFGTVFSRSNKYIMALVQKIQLGDRSGCRFSPKTRNWMLRGPRGNFKQAKKLLDRVMRWHRLLGQKCRAEVRIWE